jgi:cell wall-associated NlpC family hydrolase
MATPASEALASIRGAAHLTIAGRALTADVAGRLESASVTFSIEESPTITLGLGDSTRQILNSGLLARGTHVRVDKYAFMLVQNSYQGGALTTTWESSVSARLRQHTKRVKIAPGKMTHVQFARQLVREERWVEFHTAHGVKVPKSKTELSRGLPSNRVDGHAESTWDALGRMASDRGWRRYVVGSAGVWYVPETWLYRQPASYSWKPENDGVDSIEFDHDIGKAYAQLTVMARAARWFAPLGQTVNVSGIGPANGKWLVTQIERDLFGLDVTVTLKQPQPTLPEPKPSDNGSSSSTKGTTSKMADDFVNIALSEVGKPYVLGADGPSSFDCSGLVQFSAHKVGLTGVPRTAREQWNYCRSHNRDISLNRAKHTRGALIFRIGHGSFNHVVISLGDGERTVEAMGRAYGVRRGSIDGRDWTGAALLPGMRY